jgi:hypothetical protein
MSNDTFAIWNDTYSSCEFLIQSGLWPAALEVCQLMVEGILGIRYIRY